MVRCWYMEESSFDQRLEHHFDPCQYLSLLELFDCTGVECFKVDHESYETDETLKNLRTERGYTFEDEIHFHSDSPNYEEKLQNFYTEHLHTHEEIRLIVAGSGYFDVRDKDDRWIRLKVTAGDLIIIPSGIYHRFTLDVNNYIKAKRYFIGIPSWLPYNRPAEDMFCRKEYLERLEQGFKVERLNA